MNWPNPAFLLRNPGNGCSPVTPKTLFKNHVLELIFTWWLLLLVFTFPMFLLLLCSRLWLQRKQHWCCQCQVRIRNKIVWQMKYFKIATTLSNRSDSNPCPVYPKMPMFCCVYTLIHIFFEYVIIVFGNNK